MNINKLFNNSVIKALPPNEFKAYIILKIKAKNDIISNFTIRGLVRDWNNDSLLNMPTAKNTVKDIIRSLQEKGLITHKIKSKELIINKQDE